MRNFLIAVVVFILCSILTVWGWSYWASHTQMLGSSWGNAHGYAAVGQWGDSFGGFNALFGALGFSAVLATLISQLKTINDQLRDQHRQRFDASFFEIVRLIDALRSELRFIHSRDYIRRQNPPIGATPKTGRNAIMAATIEMRTWIRLIRARDKCVSEQQIAAYYMKYIHGRYEGRFAPYFRMIYTILSRIKSDKVLTISEKVYYANIIRSHLSTHEISLLAINSLAPISGTMKELVEEFRMLKYLPRGSMKRTLEEHFSKATFLARDDT